MLLMKYENLMKAEEPLLVDKQELTLEGLPPVPASNSTQKWQQLISSASPPIFLRKSSMSIVSSNSTLIMCIKASFETDPSLSGCPPRQTKQSRYSSDSFSCSLYSSNSLRYVSVPISVWILMFITSFLSRNSFSCAMRSSSKL